MYTRTGLQGRQGGIPRIAEVVANSTHLKSAV